MREVYEFLFVKGGYMMYPLVLCAVVELAILFERLWFLQRPRILPPGLPRLVRRLVREGRVEEATAVCTSNDSSLGAIYAAGLGAVGRPRDVIREKIEDAGRVETAILDRYVNALAVLASVATLLGLLGTVTGMISVFQRVSEAVGTDVDERTRLLAGGIWEILINTASGLSIAVTSIVGHGFLQGRVNNLLVDLETEGKQLIELLDEQSGKPPGGPVSEGTAEPRGLAEIGPPPSVAET